MKITLTAMREKLNSLGKSDMRSRPDQAPVLSALGENETVSLPRVNLLPGAIRQSIRINNTIKRFAIASGVIVGLAVVVYLMQIPAINQAEEKLNISMESNQELNAQVVALSPIGELYAALTRQQDFVKETLASSPRASEVFVRMQRAADQVGPSAVTITSTSISYQGIPLPDATFNPCPNPDPFNESITIGCMSFNATADSRDQISSFLNYLAADPLFVGPFVDSSIINTTTTDGNQGSGSQVSFSGTAGISIDGLQTKLTPEEISALTTPDENQSAEGAN